MSKDFNISIEDILEGEILTKNKKTTDYDLLDNELDVDNMKFKKNPFAKKSAHFGFLGSVIYRFGLNYFAVRPTSYLFGRSNAYLN